MSCGHRIGVFLQPEDYCLKLDPAQCRAHAYGGAGNMTGVINGCAANLMKIVPQAHYYHCASHSLNAALSKAYMAHKVQNMMSSKQTLATFFKYLPKRNNE